MDYLENPGASSRLSRTNVEVSVLSGAFSENEIVDIYRSLEKVDSLRSSRICATSFADLTYWARYAEAEVPKVPIGLWRMHREPSPIGRRWLSEQEAADYLMARGLPTTIGEFFTDSLAATHDPESRDLEVVYCSGNDRGKEIRLIMRQPHVDLEEASLQPEQHPSTQATLTVRDRIVHVAWIDPRYGPYDAIVGASRGNLQLRVLTSAAVGHTYDWFTDILDFILYELS